MNTDPDVVAQIVYGALLSPEDPFCQEIVRSMAGYIEHVVDEHENKGLTN